MLNELDDIKTAISENNMREAFSKIRRLRNKRTQRIYPSDPIQQTANRFEEFYEQLFENGNIATISTTTKPAHSVKIPKSNDKTYIPLPGLEELVQTIPKSKRNKASGPDNLSAEILQQS